MYLIPQTVSQLHGKATDSLFEILFADIFSIFHPLIYFYFQSFFFFVLTEEPAAMRNIAFRTGHNILWYMLFSLVFLRNQSWCL